MTPDPHASSQSAGGFLLPCGLRVVPGGLSAEPVKLTFCQWHNRRFTAPDGTPDGEKILAHRGRMTQFRYGTTTYGRKATVWPLQWAAVCTFESKVFVIDIDDLQEFLATRTARCVGPAQAMSRRGDRCHILADGRGLVKSLWPRHGPIAGGDILANGWVPCPGSEHWTGMPYEPVLDPYGRFPVMPGTTELLAAIKADQDDEKARRRAERQARGGSVVPQVRCVPQSRIADGRISANAVDAEAIMAEGAPVSERNDTYHKLACSRFRRHGTGPDGNAAVLGELRAAWEAGETAGMPWTEVLGLGRSARRFIAEQEAAERLLMTQWQAYVSGAAR